MRAIDPALPGYLSHADLVTKYKAEVLGLVAYTDAQGDLVNAAFLRRLANEAHGFSTAALRRIVEG